MAKRSAWRTVGLIAGVGCLTMIVVVVGGIVITVMVARNAASNLGDPNPRPVERRIALTPPATDAAAKSATRSEERRVGKEGRLRGLTYHSRIKSTTSQA